ASETGEKSVARSKGLSTDVAEERDHLLDLSDGDWTDVAQHRIHSPDGNRPYLVTLRRRRDTQPIAEVRLDLELRHQLPQTGSERDNVDDCRLPLENPLRGDDDRRPGHPGLSASRRAEVEGYDVTRGQHRATRCPRC